PLSAGVIADAQFGPGAIQGCPHCARWTGGDIHHCGGLRSLVNSVSKKSRRRSPSTPSTENRGTKPKVPLAVFSHANTKITRDAGRRSEAAQSFLRDTAKRPLPCL